MGCAVHPPRRPEPEHGATAQRAAGKSLCPDAFALPGRISAAAPLAASLCLQFKISQFQLEV